MVFFTCNACGQSIKKSKVEKHYKAECRDCAVLSCLDCGKDFHGDEYASHTSCITEAQKYQGKLYKDPNRGQAPKGEKKQQEWMEKVKQAAATSRVTNPRLAKLLDRLEEYTNIPRKMKKFQNFVGNSLNVRDQKTLDELWSVFSEIQRSNESGSAGVDSNKKESEGTNMSVATDSTTATVAKDGVVEADKVKTKKKRHSEIDNAAVISDDDFITEDVTSTKKKMKIHKNHSEKDSTETALYAVTDGDVVEGGVKEKKKSKRHLGEGSTEADGIVGAAEGDSKTKKKKRKHLDEEDTVGACLGTSLSAAEEDYSRGAKKKNKPKGVLVDSDELIMNTNQLDIQLLSDSQPPVVTDESTIKKRKKSKKKTAAPEQVAQYGFDEQVTVDMLHKPTDNVVENSISHWVSSISETETGKKKKAKHIHNDTVDTADIEPNHNVDTDLSAVVGAQTLLNGDKKKLKSKHGGSDDEVTVEVMVPERKKKRKHKVAEDAPAEKMAKLQSDDEIEKPSVKKHKKKVKL